MVTTMPARKSKGTILGLDRSKKARETWRGYVLCSCGAPIYVTQAAVSVELVGQLLQRNAQGVTGEYRRHVRYNHRNVVHEMSCELRRAVWCRLRDCWYHTPYDVPERAAVEIEAHLRAKHRTSSGLRVISSSSRFRTPREERMAARR